jgi:peptidoglycan/xylan/chitin deacetylase (PgdA/CDA1 family)
MLQQIREQRMRCVLGSVYPFDPQIPFVGFLSTYILKKTFPGAIIILHDGKLSRKRTITVLHKIIPELQRRGYEFVTLSKLVQDE